MLRDFYAMNKKTGEIVPTVEAIREFYKNHAALDDWRDDWEETEIPVENSTISAPDFLAAVNI